MLKMGNWLLNCKSHKESLKAYKSEEVTLVPELNLDKNNAFQRSYYDNCDKCMFFKQGKYLKKYEKIVEILIYLEYNIFKNFSLVQAYHLKTNVQN